MGYSIVFEKLAKKELAKLDKSQQELIISWIDKNLKTTENPRVLGKALKGEKSGYWRYRVGDYRLIAKITDTEITIFIVRIGHRKNVYKF